ncbi:MAG: hypothetical protein EOP81_02815 [Variovorax sp.]|nr:MAG: hypothetical protein EOP81_02815 [Variovorax sp.]
MSSSPFFALTPVTLRPDFVASDMDALAVHMRTCARARSRMSLVRGGLQRMHSVAAGRIVTIAFALVVIGVGAMAVA